MTRYTRRAALTLALLALLVVPVGEAAGIQTLVSFTGTNNGSGPRAALLDVNNTLYGTTHTGGTGTQCTGNCGTLFSYAPTSRSLSKLVNFNYTNGALPDARLANVGGTLYGTTSRGGAHNDGTLFSYDPNSKNFKTLVNFDYSNGASAYAGLTNVGGKLYATTASGGAHGDGTLFSFDPASTSLNTLASFNGTNGNGPYATLTDVGGILYGSSYLGGTGTNSHCTYGCGTLFAYDPTSGSLSTLVNFNYSNGTHPYAGLFNVGGTLYGTTLLGGTSSSCSSGCGTLFSYSPANGNLNTLASFDSANGSTPYGGLTNVGSTLYGSTSAGGGSGEGTLFSYALPATTPVPEPSVLAIMATGLCGLMGLGYRRRNQGGRL